MDGTIQNITKKATSSFSNRDFEKMSKYQQCVTEIDNLQVKLESYMSLLELDIDIEDNPEKTTNYTDRKINYADYAVDSNTEYSLIEDFTHKRPAGFKLLGNRIEASDWKEIYVLTCQELAKKDYSIFKRFLDDKTMQGKKIAYFSTSATGMRNTAFISDAKIYITTNMSANGIRNIIQKMLKKYYLPLSEYKVYLKADYSAFHNDNEDD
jgi:hypothetical protein